MNQFRFAHVEWLHALWLVALCGLILMALEFRGARVLERMLSPLMQSRLVRRPSLSRRLLSVWLLCGALATVVVALMRPQWGSTVQLQTRVDSQIMICLDVSRSMLAEDVVPNRLERAKAEIDSLLSIMQDGQQVGLMAFAGKASVLCPLTTDFGFLRLILAEANPGTVGLGGTRIGAALSKAVEGFREVGDVNRLILLITDGEDHDSFPLDAAQQAREKGVRIVSIGFGDELGSKIEVTDPQTGARSYIEDREGKPVISRLDGETLRQIALETEGAYIPAGTGALDWQSIYTSHIAGFLGGTTAQEETVIRNEAYQWCVLVALVLLLAALATPTLFSGEAAVNRAIQTKSTAASQAAIGLVWVFGSLSLGHGSALWAQVASAQSVPPASAASSNGAAQPPGPPSEVPSSRRSAVTASSEQADGSPREIYNRAVALVSSDVDQAERLLNAARREAQVDGELRYRAVYNLGWVEVNRAQELLGTEPEQALKHLEMAASRFREAIRVRPDSDDARHNLEIISRRILELADSLAQKSPTEFAPRLDEIVTRMRQHQSELQRMTTQLATGEQDGGHAVEKYRQDFRQLGVVERQIIADVEKLAADARRHLSAEQTANQSQSPPVAEKQLQAAQISAMLPHLERSIQRMHKARSFVRRLQSDRAFVRWAAGLTDAKRARDQLRDPLDILSVLIADATQLRNLSLLMNRPIAEPDAQAAVSTQPSGQAGIGTHRPSWLSQELIADEQLATTQRTSELHDLLSAGATQAAQPASAGPQGGAPPDGQQQQLLANIQQALPHLAAAQSLFERAGHEIEDQAWINAVDQQTAGIAALQDAAELFFDIRRLIDASLDDQRQIASGVNLLEPSSSLTTQAGAAAVPVLEGTQLIDRSTLVTSQRKNLSRMERLANLFQQELTRLESPRQPPAQGAETPADADDTSASTAGEEETALERQRLEIAEKLRTNAAEAMQQVLDQLNMSTAPAAPSTAPAADAVPAERPPAPRRPTDNAQLQPAAQQEATPSPLLQASDAAVEQLEELQRLFFSVVEHLRETAGRQTELNDNTTELAAQPDRQTQEQIGPLQHRQQILQQTAQAIAQSLRDQAASSPDGASSAADVQQPDTAEPSESTAANSAEDQAEDQAEKLAQAAALVQDGQKAMQAAAGQLNAAATADQDSDREQTTSNSTGKTEALQQTEVHQQTALEKLMAALELLDPPQSQDQNQQQPQPQQQPQDKSEEKTESTPQHMDAEQLLQAIREREANRRRERQPQLPSSAGGVDKDW